MDFRIGWISFVFISHFPIDRYSLADKWLQLIKGRTLKGFMKEGNEDILTKITVERENYRILRGSFHSLVYTIVDNTFHLAIMYYGYLLFFK